MVIFDDVMLISSVKTFHGCYTQAHSKPKQEKTNTSYYQLINKPILTVTPLRVYSTYGGVRGWPSHVVLIWYRKMLKVYRELSQGPTGGGKCETFSKYTKSIVKKMKSPDCALKFEKSYIL